jgi:uncharacterized membrane protein YdjX (TVP38/TMEM64 family)
MTDRARVALVTGVLFALLALVLWLVVTDAPLIRLIIRLYSDKKFLKETVNAWGWLAPVAFIAIQALQVVISPIPGEITGPVGGALFGTLWGLIYSTIGLTAGTLFCFWVGRRWGEPLVRPWLSAHNWNRMSFILEAEGVIICFILYLIPGFPKDIISYLFGISPRRRAAVHLRDRVHGDHPGGLSAPLLLPGAAHQALPQAPECRGRARESA